MNALRAVSLLVLLSTVVARPPDAAQAAVIDPVQVCINLKSSGLGAPHLSLALVASQVGGFFIFQLNGQATFSQAVAPPDSVVNYGVAGTAVPIAGGFFASLTGVGLDLAQNAFSGTFAIQLNADPTKNTLTYAKRSLDGTTGTVLSGSAEVVSCSASVADSP
jgi:hypothetical protein